MHWPRHAPALRGALLRLLAPLTAYRAFRAVLVKKQLRDTRNDELPERW